MDIPLCVEQFLAKAVSDFGPGVEWSPGHHATDRSLCTLAGIDRTPESWRNLVIPSYPLPPRKHLPCHPGKVSILYSTKFSGGVGSLKGLKDCIDEGPHMARISMTLSGNDTDHGSDLQHGRCPSGSCRNW